MPVEMQPYVCTYNSATKLSSLDEEPHVSPSLLIEVICPLLVELAFITIKLMLKTIFLMHLSTHAYFHYKQKLMMLEWLC